ncbi:hypothetical protein ACOZD1_28045, partial [Streptomyces rhizosphaericola]
GGGARPHTPHLCLCLCSQPARPRRGRPPPPHLREFVTILRAEHSPQERVAFLRERRTALEQRLAALHRAMEVLDEKIAYYS